MQRRFAQVDVFSQQRYLGNSLAVVVDGDGLDSTEMQRFARWTNLAETTFLLAPSNPAADYRVRIFTPGAELPFAGHPTLGSAHAWLVNGGTPRHPDAIVQECGVGLVTVRREGDALSFAAPPLLRGGPADDATLQQAADATSSAGGSAGKKRKKKGLGTFLMAWFERSAQFRAERRRMNSGNLLNEETTDQTW